MPYVIVIALARNEPMNRQEGCWGGGGALGSAIADLFTQAGARVVVAGRRRLTGDHPSVAFDVTDDTPRWTNFPSAGSDCRTKWLRRRSCLQASLVVICSSVRHWGQIVET